MFLHLSRVPAWLQLSRKVSLLAAAVRLVPAWKQQALRMSPQYLSRCLAASDAVLLRLEYVSKHGTCIACDSTMTAALVARATDQRSAP
jgi:hypothetical protein